MILWLPEVLVGPTVFSSLWLGTQTYKDPDMDPDTHADTDPESCPILVLFYEQLCCGALYKLLKVEKKNGPRAREVSVKPRHLCGALPEAHAKGVLIRLGSLIVDWSFELLVM